ncbi:MAG: dihydrofolate reductase [bacterium]
MDIALIWAMADNRVIGRNNTLPWRLPTDMRHFMRTTMGKPLLMGRKTMESMKAPLPGRTNIVLTRNTHWQRDGVRVVHNLDDALALAEQQCLIDGQNELMVIGGADLYTLCLPLADKLHITHVAGNPAGDVFFPEFDLTRWDCVSRVEHTADERHSADFVIAEYIRKP